jgi:DNA-binding response OmpR family regulator
MSDPKPTVLIADDNLEILRILRKRLSQDYEVLEAHNGAEAIRIAEDSKPACVVLDVMMPEVNGWEVARHLRRNADLDGIGILMLTAIGETLNEITSPLYGADEQLDKPFDLEEVADAVARIIASR